MARSVSFWQLPEDQEEFESFVKSTGDVLCYSPMSFDDPRNIPKCSFGDHQNISAYNRVYLTLREWESEVFVTRGHGDGIADVWGVDLTMSPIVSYTWGDLVDDQLPLSTLFFHAAFPEMRLERITDKRDGFVRWAGKVLTWVRKFTPNWYDYKNYRATDRVRIAVDAGRIHLKPY